MVTSRWLISCFSCLASCIELRLLGTSGREIKLNPIIPFPREFIDAFTESSKTNRLGWCHCLCHEKNKAKILLDSKCSATELWLWLSFQGHLSHLVVLQPVNHSIHYFYYLWRFGNLHARMIWILFSLQLGSLLLSFFLSAEHNFCCAANQLACNQEKVIWKKTKQQRKS